MATGGEYELGYDDSRFEIVVSQRFHCPICSLVLKDPVMCKNQHYGCFSCIKRHLENSKTCPTCLEYLSVDTLIEAQRIVTDYLSELNINCDFQPRGCPEIVQLDQLKRHVANCGFAPAPCSNTGCNVFVNLSDKLRHEAEECEFRRSDSHDCGQLKEEVKEMKEQMLASQNQTKDEMKAELRSEMKGMKEEFKGDMKVIKEEMSIEMKAEMREVRNEVKEGMKKEIKGMEKETKAELRSEVKGMKDEMKGDINTMKEEIAVEMKAEMREVKNEVKEMKKEIKGMENEIKAELGNEVYEMKEEIKEMKGDIKVIKEEIQGEIKGEMREVKNEMKEEMTEVKNEVKEGMKEMQNEMKVKMKDEIKGMKEEIKVEMKAEMNKMKNEIKGMLMSAMKNQIVETKIKKQDAQASSSSEKTGRAISIIITGGEYKEGYKYVKSKSVEQFQWPTQSWKKLNPMSTDRAAHSSFVYEGHMTVVGGSSDAGGTDSAESLNVTDPRAVWKDAGFKLPVKCYAHTVVNHKDQLIMSGGRVQPSKGGKFEPSDGVYEIQLVPPHASQILTKLPQPRSHHGMELFDEKLFILGGHDGKKATNSVVQYDLIRKECKEMPVLPNAVCEIATVLWRNNVLVLGGKNEKGDPLNTVVQYDVITGRSKMLPCMKRKRYGCTAVLTGNAVVVMGGQNEKNECLKSVQCFDLERQVWQDLPDMTEARYNATAVAI